MRSEIHKFPTFIFLFLISITLISGSYIFFYIRSLEESVPVTSINQYRYLSSTLTLLTNLSTDMEVAMVNPSLERVEQARYCVIKTISFVDLIEENFNGKIPENLLPLLNELEILLSAFKQLTNGEGEFDQTTATVMHNRLEYVITEFQAFVVRMNDTALINLEKQVRNVEILSQSVTIALLLIFVSASAMTYFILLQRKMIQTIEGAVEEASLANSAKSEFLANMSHEIRTPMNAIIGFTELLYLEENNPEKKDKLRMIKASGNNLLLLINDILDFSKIEAGKIDIENKDFNLKESLNYLHSMFLSKIEDKGLDFSINTDKSVPEIVYGDEHRIIQILTNIIGNAIKFTKRGGIVIDCNYYDGKVTIKVSDTGIGIPDNKLEHIFSAFGQAESFTTRKFGGTGLGLAISRQLALLLEGTLTAKSRTGYGSVFTLELPLPEITKNPETHKELSHKTKDIISEESEIASAAVEDSYRILLAEDNRINQMLVKAILKSMDYVCDIAENGKIALDKLSLNHYDLLLLDMQMPVMDGMETIKHIRANENHKNLHVIALTANAMAGDAENYINAGCDDYISKPVDTELLKRKVIKYLGEDLQK